MDKYYEGESEYEEVLDCIDAMLDNDDASKVAEFLGSVQAFAEDAGFITEAQYDGVMNCWKIHGDGR